MVIKLDVRKLYGRPRASLHWPKFLVTRMLSRDLFAVLGRTVSGRRRRYRIGLQKCLYWRRPMESQRHCRRWI